MSAASGPRGLRRDRTGTTTPGMRRRAGSTFTAAGGTPLAATRPLHGRWCWVRRCRAAAGCGPGAWAGYSRLTARCGREWARRRSRSTIGQCAGGDREVRRRVAESVSGRVQSLARCCPGLFMDVLSRTTGPCTGIRCVCCRCPLKSLRVNRAIYSALSLFRYGFNRNARCPVGSQSVHLK